MPRESVYQANLIKKLRKLYPGAIVLKNDSGYMQGIPDLTILYRDKWAALEVKAKEPNGSDIFQPNQEWFIEKMNDMSFAACIYPENEKEVLRGLQQALAPRGQARVSVR
ncbi:endonuclease [Rhodococcus phage ReqiPoco6]|uniref:Gp104 n=1 Tax=Rhodococcus phage ReqiPoco6 TaxID=691964 RepID=D4P7X2_9CAUD|nr:endonuclease [Rhodococcus phage ReqiPoco6]ADD81102.1 gp104 [Rhodococcus phage ReqiPoco6]